MRHSASAAASAPALRKVLIVSPRFPPTNAADLHRIRISLGHYRAQGWQPSILCVDPSTADCPTDSMLAQSLPQNVAVTRVQAWSEAKCRRFGFGQLGYRSLLPLYRAGCRLLRREHHDIVFFSTTVFLSFVLGPLWKWLYGCRIIYDFHDPWASDRLLYTRLTVPGSWWKYRLDQWLARYLERFAMQAADHIITVSEGYVRNLSQRYRRLDASKFTVLPFAGTAEDYQFARDRRARHHVFVSDRQYVRWGCAGAIVPDMGPILTELFRALTGLQKDDPGFAMRLRLTFVGTDYAAPGRAYKRVEPLARQQGVHDIIEEIPARIPYFETISFYEACDALLVIGSIDPDYTASKLISCAFSKKPVLALFHQRSLVPKLAGGFSNVRLATFDETPAEPGFRSQLASGINWLRAPGFDPAALDDELAPWSGDQSTRVQCAIFDRVCPVARPGAASRPRCYMPG